MVMVEMPSVHLRGHLGSLGRSIIQRLLRDSVNIIVQEEHYSSLNQFFSTELEFSKSQILSSHSHPIAPGHRVLLLGFENYKSSADDLDVGIGVDGAEVILVTPSINHIEIDSSEIDGHFIIHDLIPSDSIPPWNNQYLDEMIDSLIGGSDYKNTGHVGWWVAELDVADAISRLMLSKHPSPKEVNFAGRRSWKLGQVFDELQMLYKRTIAGQSGDFTTEHLTSPSTPHIELVPVEQSMQSKRPNLESLHESLVLADGDGWRSMTPIRTALMHFLIGKMN
ncbi:MAG: hypothetical protein QF479_01000 [Candidatus Poseidoniaceae archaeon]|jgi:hypothetical protein|nr:hypothetical protein [Candidatus Poseidoniaceae archaeon]